MSIDLETARVLVRGRRKVYDGGGNKIGNLGQVYVDDETGEPNWVTVRTGLFGLSESFAPLDGAELKGDDLYVRPSESQVKQAPRIDPDGSLTPVEEEQLYAHYASLDAGSQTPEPVHSSSQDDPGSDAETIGGRPLRLRKYIVTEEASVTVPVRREEVRLEPEPESDDTNTATGDGRADGTQSGRGTKDDSSDRTGR